MNARSIYRIESGGQTRAVKGREARAKIDRELHGLVLSTGKVAKRVPEHAADWFYDLRRKQLRVYGGLLRFIDVSAETGIPRDIVKQIPAILDAYIDDIYEGQPDPDRPVAGAIRLPRAA